MDGRYLEKVTVTFRVTSDFRAGLKARVSYDPLCGAQVSSATFAWVVVTSEKRRALTGSD